MENPPVPVLLEFAQRESAHEPKRARGYLDQVLARTPNQAMALRLLTELDLAAGRSDAALARIDATARAGPLSPPLVLLRAQILAAAGDWTRAEGEARRAFAASPELPDAVELLTGIYRAQDRLEAAIASLQETEKLGALPASGLQLLARLHDAAGHPSAARGTLREGARGAQRSAHCQDRSGPAARRRGRRPRPRARARNRSAECRAGAAPRSPTRSAPCTSRRDSSRRRCSTSNPRSKRPGAPARTSRSSGPCTTTTGDWRSRRSAATTRLRSPSRARSSSTRTSRTPTRRGANSTPPGPPPLRNRVSPGSRLLSLRLRGKRPLRLRGKHRARGWIATPALLAVVILLGLGLRGFTFQRVFRGDAIVFPVGDAYYHLRLAEFSLRRLPDVLRFDPLVNHPGGAWIPWPPLHTLLLASAGRALGGTQHDLELAGAWLPPLLGALTALPVFGATTVLAGRGIALLAALLVALFPISISYSDVGNADHHCTVSLFGALWLWGALLAVREQPGRSLRIAAQALVMLGRLGVVFSWGGSLLYVFLADGAVLTVLALRGRAGALRAHAFGLVATALPVALAVPALGPPVGGSYTALSLSYLHAPALLALASVAFVCAALERSRPTRSVGVRAARSAALAAIAAAALLALPGLLPTLRAGAGFVGKEEPWAAQQRRTAAALRAGTRQRLAAPALVLRRLRLRDPAGAAGPALRRARPATPRSRARARVLDRGLRRTRNGAAPLRQRLRACRSSRLRSLHRHAAPRVAGAARAHRRDARHAARSGSDRRATRAAGAFRDRSTQRPGGRGRVARHAGRNAPAFCRGGAPRDARDRRLLRPARAPRLWNPVPGERRTRAPLRRASRDAVGRLRALLWIASLGAEPAFLRAALGRSRGARGRCADGALRDDGRVRPRRVPQPHPTPAPRGRPRARRFAALRALPVGDRRAARGTPARPTSTAESRRPASRPTSSSSAWPAP